MGLDWCFVDLANVSRQDSFMAWAEPWFQVRLVELAPARRVSLQLEMAPLVPLPDRASTELPRSEANRPTRARPHRHSNVRAPALVRASLIQIG